MGEEYITQNAAIGLGLGFSEMGGSVMLTSIGFGKKEGSYFGIHAMAGFLLPFNFGIYTNGTRLLFLFGAGLGGGAAAGISSMDLIKSAP